MTDTSLVARKKRGRKKKQQLEGFIQSGMLFIGDPQYMAANPQDFEGGVIPEDGTNPFKDFNTFSEKNYGQDVNLHLPDSYRDNPIGRGCVVQLQQLSGKYQIKKRIDKKTGKVKAITIKLYE
jgi:hypothetical protein